jgi:SAM-dependent methyltransferase
MTRVQLDQECVTLINRDFYGRFPYPWAPMTFRRFKDPAFETIMLNQSIGDFEHCTVKPDATIWVAGCGTNQAIYTALRFPAASIVASDVSDTSLDVCFRRARQFGITNLVLRCEDINTVDYVNVFDYIICTGVIHHNAHPSVTLTKIAQAMKLDGVLELMVYNTFHRTVLRAWQEAIRVVARGSQQPATLDDRLRLAKSMLEHTLVYDCVQNDIPHLKEPLSFHSDEELADALLQPVEHSYDVASLASMLRECDLELLLPCYNQFDKAAAHMSWTLKVESEDLQSKIRALEDTERWHLTNLILRERSPMLWFFVTRRKGGRKYYEGSVNDRFLRSRFQKARTVVHNYVKESEGRYRLSTCPVPYPVIPNDSNIARIMELAERGFTMGDVLDQMNIDTRNGNVVSDIRTHIATTTCPYLAALR